MAAKGASRSSSARTWAAALVVCAACYVAASIGSIIRFPGTGAAVFFPPDAILAAALLRTRPRSWWIWILACSTGNIWAHAHAGESLSFVLLAELANNARALVAVVGIRRFAGNRRSIFNSLRGMSLFLVFAGVIGPLAGATLGAGAAVAHHHATSYWPTWRSWFLSNTLTGLTLLPIALILPRSAALAPFSGGMSLRHTRVMEGMLLVLALVAATGLVFFEPVGGHAASPASLYLPLPLLLWASVRFGPLGTSSSLLLVSSVAIWGTLLGRGPLVGGPPETELLELQAFLLAVSVPLLLLSALLGEQHRTSEALQASQIQYLTVVEDQSEMICRLGSDDAVSFVNGAFCRRMSRSRQDLLGQSFVALMPPDRQAQVSHLLAGLTPDQHEASWEQETHGESGQSLRSELWKARAFFESEGRLLYYQVIGRDITERKRAEEEHRLLVAEQARADVLQDADRRKDEFIAMLAHELRNPLSPIALVVEILRRQPSVDEEHVLWARDVIGRQVNQLSRLVDDLLDVSRIRWGTFQLRKDSVDLREVVTTAVETSGPQIESRGIDLALEMAEGPLRVSGDAARLAQLVSNLLNNAAKFSPVGGRVELSVARSDSELVVSVRDHGVGIAPEMLERVFEPFVQADRSRDTALGGLGLGLSLVKRLAETHGGRVKVRSEGPGLGAEFLVWLPALDAGGEESSSRCQPDENAAVGLRVLVVDDSPDSAEALAQYLALHGCDVHVVTNGQAGLEAAEQTSPEIVFLDIRMPGMSGLDVARQLRRLHGASRMVLVATTGEGQPEDQRQAAEAGFDYHLVKPVDPGQLIAIISAHRSES